VQSVDGSVTALDRRTGDERWVYTASEPDLTLRGTGTPQAIDPVTFAGLANGRLVTLDNRSGQPLWERRIAVPQGRSEIERLVDLDGQPLLTPDGRLFAGTIAMDKTEGAATLYRLDPGPVCTPVIPNVTNSNGLGWSPDGGTLYYIDTPTREISAFRYVSGHLSERRMLVETGSLIDASPDGMCVDAEGHLWVAFCHGGCVMRFDHQTGDVLERIEVPAKETTSCCFGGEDLSDLYITTGVGTGEKKSDGRVYVVRGMGVQGQEQVAVRA